MPNLPDLPESDEEDSESEKNNEETDENNPEREDPVIVNRSDPPAIIEKKTQSLDVQKLLQLCVNLRKDHSG